MKRLSWYLDKKSTGQAKPKSFRLFSYGKNTFLFVLIRILPHILGGSPASQRKIIQQATGQWFSVLWLHILFCSYGGVQVCVMNGSLQTGGFVDLSVFGKNRRTEGYPHKSLVVVSVLLNTESNPSAENYMLKRAVIKMLCSLLCMCVCYGRG